MEERKEKKEAWVVGNTKITSVRADPLHSNAIPIQNVMQL